MMPAAYHNRVSLSARPAFEHRRAVSGPATLLPRFVTVMTTSTSLIPSEKAPICYVSASGPVQQSASWRET
jgi:hypothetical protein